MPDVNFNFQAAVAKGSLAQSFSASGITANMNASGMVAVSPTLGTTPVTLSTTGLAAVGLAILRNLSTVETATVSLGRWDGTTLWDSVSARGNEAAVFRMSPGNYAMKAAMEGTKALVQIIEG